MLAFVASDLKPVYLLTGTDRPKITRAVRRLRDRFGADCTEHLNAREASAADVIAACNAMGLFGGGDGRLVIVDEVERWKADDVKAVAEYLASPAPATVLALAAAELKADSALAKSVKKTGADCALCRLGALDCLLQLLLGLAACLFGQSVKEGALGVDDGVFLCVQPALGDVAKVVNPLLCLVDSRVQAFPRGQLLGLGIHRLASAVGQLRERAFRLGALAFPLIALVCERNAAQANLLQGVERCRCLSAASHH